MATKTAWQILQETPLKTLSFGCKVIDSSIGRFPCRGICEVSGEAGAGKTQIALTLAIQAILSDDYSQVEGEAAYITCGEGLFPVRRLSQIAQSYENLEKGISVKDILSRVHIEECMNFEDVAEAVKSKIPEMCRSSRINLLIIDSLAGMIRHEYDAMNAADMRDRTNFVFRFSKQLKWLSDVFQLGILVINQVTASGGIISATSDRQYSNFTDTSSIPALGLTWTTCISHRYYVSKSSIAVRSESRYEDEANSIDQGSTNISTRLNRRMLELVFSPLYPNRACYFIVDDSGLHGV